MKQNIGFNELRQNETETINGGIGFWGGIAIGIGAGYIVDGVLIAATGKSGAEWVVSVLADNQNRWGSYNQNGLGGGGRKF